MRQEFYYPSCGGGMIHGCRWMPEGEVKAIVQFVHGIAEYAERYEEYKIKITQIHVENREKQTEEVERAMWVYLTENYCSEVLIE